MSLDDGEYRRTKLHFISSNILIKSSDHIMLFQSKHDAS